MSTQSQELLALLEKQKNEMDHHPKEEGADIHITPTQILCVLHEVKDNIRLFEKLSEFIDPWFSNQGLDSVLKIALKTGYDNLFWDKLRETKRAWEGSHKPENYQEIIKDLYLAACMREDDSLAYTSLLYHEPFYKWPDEIGRAFLFTILKKSWEKNYSLDRTLRILKDNHFEPLPLSVETLNEIKRILIERMRYAFEEEEDNLNWRNTTEGSKELKKRREDIRGIIEAIEKKILLIELEEYKKNEMLLKKMIYTNLAFGGIAVSGQLMYNFFSSKRYGNYNKNHPGSPNNSDAPNKPGSSADASPNNKPSNSHSLDLSLRLRDTQNSLAKFTPHSETLPLTEQRSSFHSGCTRFGMNRSKWKPHEKPSSFNIRPYNHFSNSLFGYRNHCSSHGFGNFASGYFKRSFLKSNPQLQTQPARVVSRFFFKR